MAKMKSSSTKASPSSDELNNLPYWKKFNLAQDPFTEHYPEDPEIYLSLSDNDANIDLINHLIHFNNVLIAFVGPQGVGKSFFLHRYLKNTDSESVYAHHDSASDKLTPGQLVSLINFAFEVAIPEDETEPEKQFEKQIEALQFLDQQSLLVLDDAHLLPPATLQLLLEAIVNQSDDQMNFHVLLFGDPELLSQLEKLTASDDDLKELYHLIEMEPLNQSQTEQYLRELLLANGLKGDFPLSHGDIGKIWKTSGGIPGRINNVCKQVMCDAEVGATSKGGRFSGIWQNHKRTIIGALILLVAFIAVSVVADFYEQQAQDTNAEQTQTLAIPAKTAPTKPASKKTAPSPVAITTRADLPNLREGSVDKTKPAEKSPIKETVVTQPTPAPKPKPAPLVKKPEGIASSLSREESSSTGASPKATPQRVDKEKAHTENVIANKKMLKAIKQNSLASDRNVTTQASLPAITREKATPKTVTTLKPNSPYEKLVKAKKAPVTTRAALTPISRAKPTPVKKAKPVKHAKPSLPSNRTLSSDERALLNVNSRRYAIQLMAAVQRVSLRQLRNQGLRSKLYEYRTWRSGVRWYVAVTGQYRSRAAASAAIRRLPASLRRYKPWVKGYKQIHKEIRRKK